MTIDNLSLEFLDIVCNFNPYFATLKGIEKAFMPDYSFKNVNNTIKTLELLLIKVDKEEESKEKRTLFDSIKALIFFLEHRNLWNSPLYYIEKLYLLVSVCWSKYDYLKTGNINLNVLNNRLNHLPDYLKQVIANLTDIKLPKLDCIYAVSKLEDFKNNFLNVVSNFTNFSHVPINESIEEFKSFLINKKESSNNFINPIGKDIVTYLNKETGLLFDDSKLKKKIENLILELSKNSTYEYIKNDFKNEVDTVIKNIFETGQNLFGGSIAYINNIAYKENNSNNYDLNYLEYVPSPPLSGNNEGIFLYTKKFIEKDKYSHNLGIIHEIYPGHHYITQKYRENNIGNLSILLYENNAFSEGWAKFCEFIYASKLMEDKQFLSCFNSQMIKVALLGLVSIKLHIDKIKYDDVLKEISIKYNLPSDKCKSLLLQAYLFPTDCISNILGFIFFIDNYNNENIRNMLEEIYINGPLIMKGKEL